jgi:hypothetical protein
MGGLHVINLSTAWCPPPEAGAGGVWLRRFGRPAGLESGEAVWVVIESPPGCGAVLNGVPLPRVEPGQTIRHDVTTLLQQRNELLLGPPELLTRALGPPSARPRCPLPMELGQVRLEIEPGRPNSGETP